MKRFSISRGTITFLAASLFLISAGFSFWHRELPKLSPQTPSSLLPPSQTVPGEATGLKTYQNDKYGFEFQYPEAVEITNKWEGEGTEEDPFLLHFEFCPNHASCGMLNDKYLSIETAPVTSIDQLHYDYSQIPTTEQFKEKKKFMLGGEEAILTTFKNDNDTKFVQVIHEGKLISFLVRDYAFSERFAETLLSSFKFIK